MAIGKLSEADATALLVDLRSALNADGYDLQLVGIDDKVRLNITVARDDCCEECLVSPKAMSQYAATALQERYAAVTADDIELTYPAEQH